MKKKTKNLNFLSAASKPKLQICMQNLAAVKVAACGCDKSQEFSSENLHSYPSLAPLVVLPWFQCASRQSLL